MRDAPLRSRMLRKEKDESAADRLQKDPRPKGEAVPRRPVRGAGEEKDAAGAPGTDQEVGVRPKEVQ